MWALSHARGGDNQEEQQNYREHYNLQNPIHLYAPRLGGQRLSLPAGTKPAYALRGGPALLGANCFCFFTDF